METGRGLGLLLLALLGFSLFGRSAFADQKMAKETKKGCLVCHTKMNTKELNDAGKYYKEKKTLEGYKPKPGAQK